MLFFGFKSLFGAAGHFVAGTLDMFKVCIVFYVIMLCCHRDVLATTVQEAAGYAMAMKLPPCGGVTIFFNSLLRFKGEIRTRPQAVWCRPEVPRPSGYFWGRNVWQA